MFTKNIKNHLVIFLSLTLLTLQNSCIQCPLAKNNSVAQVGKYEDFIKGDYDGKMTISEIKKYGDFGLGTFDKINGEMIILDGQFYHAYAGSKVKITKDNETSPYVTLHYFDSKDAIYSKESLNYSELINVINQIKSDPDKIYGIKITGTFSYLKLRSPPAQSKPYPPIKQVLDEQVVTEHKNIEGTLVGYYTPEKFTKTLIEGYHFHFISKNRKIGGHALDLKLAKAQIQLDQIDNENINFLAE